MSRYYYKLWTKKKVVDWYVAQPDKIKECVYIERQLGSNESANVHLCINSKPNRTTVCRTGQRVFEWFNIEPLASDFINVKYFKIVSIK